MAKNKAVAEVTVNDTLRDLGLAGGDDAPEQSGQGGEDEDDPFTSDPPAQSTPPSGRRALREALFDASDIRPPREGYQPPPPAPSAELPPSTPLPQEPASTVYVEPQPRVRKEKPQPSPAVRRLGGALARKLPGAERVKIKKRMDNGQLAIIGEYTAADLANVSDLETFVLKYLKPKFGPGVYKLTGIDASGMELEAGEIPVLDPEPGAPENNMVSLLSTMMDRSERTQRELLERSGQQQQVDPIKMLKGLQEVQATMSGGKEEHGSTIAAVIAAQGQQMQAFMQMMAQQSQQQMQLMMAAMQPREDATLKLLLTKLVEDKASGGGASLPLPPPPPPVNPMEGLKDIVQVMATLMAGKKNGEDSELKELVRMLLARNNEQSLTPKDVIALVKEVNPPGNGSDDFRKSVENMTMMMQVAQQLRQNTEGSASAGFFDALSALFSNRDFAGSIAASIRSRTEAQQQQQLMTQQQQLLTQRQRLIADARALQAQNQSRVPPGGPSPAEVVAQQMQVPVAQATPRDSQQPQAAQSAPSAPSASTAPAMPPIPPAAAVPAEAQAFAPPPALRLPRVPSGAADHLSRVAAAKEDADLMGQTIATLIYLAEFPDWRPITEMLLGLVQRGRQTQALETVRGLFGGLSAMGLLSGELAERIAQVFAANFDTIRENLADLPLGGGDDDEEDGDDEEDEDEEDEEDGDEDPEDAEG